MRMESQFIISRFFVGLLFALGLFGFQVAAQTNGVVYLKNNIHAQRYSRDAKASYSGWVDPGEGHFILPVNTPVTIAVWKKPFVKLGFTLTDQNTGEVVFFEYKAKNMKMSQEEYIKLITSETKVSMSALSKTDQEGIKRGKAKKGMSKDGVRMALGYPATHRTPSLKSNTWTYWTNRHKTIAVEFNQDGKVTGTRR